jgi:DNA repair ATPase RecN
VWELVSGLLSDPERLLAGLDAMIEEQRRAVRGNAENETRAWLDKLAALDRKRGGYLDLAAEGIMDRDELRVKLAELQETRETAERELQAIKEHRERLEQMERDRDAVLEAYAGLVPEALDALTPEERHRIYNMLRLEVLAYPDTSLEVCGALVGGAELGDSGLLQTS